MSANPIVIDLTTLPSEVVDLTGDYSDDEEPVRKVPRREEDACSDTSDERYDDAEVAELYRVEPSDAESIGSGDFSADSRDDSDDDAAASDEDFIDDSELVIA